MQDVDKPVDIDTSGPGAEVELDPPKENLVEEQKQDDKTPAEDKTHENERETKLEDGGSADDASAKSDEPTDVQDKEKNTEQKKELEEYSEGVKRRIAKLTKKMREAERREEAATMYAKSVLAEKEKLSSRLTKLDTGFVSEKENRIKAGMEAAVAKIVVYGETDVVPLVQRHADITRLVRGQFPGHFHRPHTVFELAFNILTPPAVAQSNGDGTFGLILADDVFIQLFYNF